MSSRDTIFGKIIRKEIPADIVYESSSVLAFRDIAPQAPTHIVIIPKKPLADVGAATAEDKELLGELSLAAGEIARQQGVAESGYRLVINTGRDGGQTVFHLHVHLLAGRSLGWPPG